MKYLQKSAIFLSTVLSFVLYQNTCTAVADHLLSKENVIKRVPTAGVPDSDMLGYNSDTATC